MWCYHSQNIPLEHNKLKIRWCYHSQIWVIILVTKERGGGYMLLEYHYLLQLLPFHPWHCGICTRVANW